jgi:hypothetical protein
LLEPPEVKRFLIPKGGINLLGSSRDFQKTPSLE